MCLVCCHPEILLPWQRDVYVLFCWILHCVQKMENWKIFYILLGVKGLTKEPSRLECRVSLHLGGRNMKTRLTPKNKKSSASLRSSYMFSHFFRSF